VSSQVTATAQGTDGPVSIGDVLEGKFRVERILGEGAMGLVVEARNLRLDERVALKFLRNEARARPDIVTRFAREARAAAKIRSDHVARVYDVGGGEGDNPFIVMELLEGTDLETRITSGPVPLSEAVEYVIQACEGLTAAHAIGIVHRDIKPANLFIIDNAGIPQVKVLDFGISKAGLKNNVDEIDVGSADTKEIMGSPYYMSPEQMRSTKDVDGRADIWSLGVVLYELVTGRPPVVAAEVTAIIAEVLHEPHPPVSSLRSDLPAGLEAVIDRCLAKDRSERFSTAAELAAALVPFGPKRARESAGRAAAIAARAFGGSAPPESLPPVRLSPSSGARGTGDLGLAKTVPATPAKPAPAARMWIAAAAIGLGLAGTVYSVVGHLKATTVTAEARPRPEDAPSAAATAPPRTATATATATAEPIAADPAASAAPTSSTAAPVATPKAENALPAPHPLASTTTPSATTPRLHPRPYPVATGASGGLSPNATSPKASATDSEIRHER
jgi:serine/threonine-protein kinase